MFFGTTPNLKILGQNVTDNTQREIAHEMTKLEPAISLPIQLFDIPERSGFCVIGVHCDGAKFGDAPYTYDGRPYYKVESTTVLMPRSMFEERLRRSNPSRFAWESQTPDNFHLEDLDEDRIKGAVAYGVNRGRMPASAMTESTWGLLDKFAMTENGKIKNAAAALFIKSPTAYPQFLLRMARFQGTENKVFIDNMREKGNFYQLLDAGMAFLFKHLNQSGVIKGLRREERLEIPVEALREALTNALCHRLLDSPSGSVGISVFDDRVEIENTGHLPNIAKPNYRVIFIGKQSYLNAPSFFNFSVTAFTFSANFSGNTFAYVASVILLFECPRHFETETISSPLLRSIVAQVWRAKCE